MDRYPDWPSRLERYVRAARGKRFRRGRDDCALFACGAIAAMTGEDPGAWFRGRYRSAFAARYALRLFAGGGLAETVEKLAERYQTDEIAPPLARRGDLVLAEGFEGIDALGICVGRAAAFMMPRGLTFVPMDRVLRAWRI